MIVSDSTTLIILADLNRFELLTNLFDEIIIPKIVYQETNAKQRSGPVLLEPHKNGLS